MAGRVTVRTRDRGARALVERLGKLRAASIDVGILGASAAESHGLGGEITVAMVAEWAELGLGQPQRSWLREWADEHEAEIQQTIRQEVAAMARSGRSQRVVLERLAAWMVGSIRARIAAGIDPENAQSTIDRKGSSTPLIATGQLRSAIASRVNGG